MTTTKRTNEKPITIGSCSVYLMEYTGTLPEISAICVDANLFAYVKNGATIRYTQTSTTIKDDLGKISKTIISEDGASLQCGVLGWVGTTLKKVVSTARVSTSGSGNNARRRVKIGGTNNDDGKSYVICAHHHDATDGDCWWMLVGKNTEGLELAYTMTDGTILNPTFTAEPNDSDGTLIIYEEEIVSGVTG